MSNIEKSISSLTPRQFENLVFDLLQTIGMRDLIWRTPGADGGRDIEGKFLSQDISGQTHQQTWYVECKRYAAAIDWPTVWQKISYADNLRADFLLLVTNSNPSPNCESQISIWNSDRRLLKVRVWRGYELEQILSQLPQIAFKYGLREIKSHTSLELVGLISEIMKIVQATYVGSKLEIDTSIGLETSAALSELASRRMYDLSTYGYFVNSPYHVGDIFYEWMDIEGDAAVFDEVAIRSIATTLRYLTAAQRVFFRKQGETFHLSAVHPKRSIVESGRYLISQVGFWADVEVEIVNPDIGLLEIRPRLNQ